MSFNSLITGSSGFLGNALKKKLIENNHEVYESSTKIANLSNLNNLEIYKNIKFDFIFHTAAITHPGKNKNDFLFEQFISNQQINTNILNFWHKYQSDAKFITFGSSAMYSQEYQMNENNCLMGDPEEQYHVYAMTKRMLLEGLFTASLNKKMKFIFYVPTIFYGPNFDLNDGHFIYDLIRKIYAGKILGEEVILWGDGSQERDLLYIDDAINIIYSNLKLENEVINLGTGKNLKIIEYAKIISDYLKYDYDLIKLDNSKQIGVQKRNLIFDKLNKLKGLKELTKIENGLSKTIDFYIKKKNSN